MSKKILRKKLINLRKINFSHEDISFEQFKKILNKNKIDKNQIIGGYYPINCEIESLNILEKLEKNKFKISLPVTKKNNAMDFYEWSNKKSLNELKIVDHAIISIDRDRTVRRTLGYVHEKYSNSYKLIFANGGDQNNENIPEADICKKLNIKLIDGLGKKIQSSSWLINK